MFSILEANNIYTVRVPANCTDKLQPMDLSVNKPAKEFMRKSKNNWIKMLQISHQWTYVRMSIIKPLGAKWLVSLYDYFKTNDSIVLNGFKGGRTSRPRTFFGVAKVFYLPICSATLQTKASQLQTTTAAHYRKMKPQDLN